MYKRALFIFRRDLRLQDNTTLLAALEQAEEVVLAFIFTKAQIDENPYRSDHALQFMLESLEELSEEVEEHGGKLYFFHGDPEREIGRIVTELKIDLIAMNRDYTPYSKERDLLISNLCLKKGIDLISFDDALLNPPEENTKKDGTPYTVFTPFYKQMVERPVASPRVNRYKRYYAGPLTHALDRAYFDKILPHRLLPPSGGRKRALKILRNLEEGVPSHLSPHLKFTTCSVREAYEAACSQLGRGSGFVRSLYWRDFFTSIAFHFPHVFGSAFRPQFNRLKWTNNQEQFERWCAGGKRA